MSTRSYTVAGMSCDHCVKSVRTEVGRVPGVTAVDVELPTGTVTVHGTEPISDPLIREAIEEAGYELAG